MTLYVNLRSAAIGGTLVEPYLLEGDGMAARPAMRALHGKTAAQRLAGRQLIFAVHGFNVSYDSGLRSIARLESLLAPRLRADCVVVGVLWPGDFWLPTINYPFEWKDARDAGRRLAGFANTTARDAASLCFVSHSLGARVVLEAVRKLDRRKALAVCLTAPATDDDALERPHGADAVQQAEAFTYLASRRDKVLRVAYRIGDWVGDVFAGDDDAAWRAALGWHGARWPRSGRPTVRGLHLDPEKTNGGRGYDHGDYFPPGKKGAEAADAHVALARYLADWFSGRPAVWEG